MNTYIVVKFPEVKKLMELEGFDDNCHLVVDPIKFGPMAYMCDVVWLKEVKFLEVKS